MQKWLDGFLEITSCAVNYALMSRLLCFAPFYAVHLFHGKELKMLLTLFQIIFLWLQKRKEFGVLVSSRLHVTFDIQLDQKKVQGTHLVPRIEPWNNTEAALEEPIWQHSRSGVSREQLQWGACRFLQSSSPWSSTIWMTNYYCIALWSGWPLLGRASGHAFSVEHLIYAGSYCIIVSFENFRPL